MRRWDRLLDSYIEEYRARGVSAESVAMNTARLERWGLWLKARRPRVGIERIDAELITRYIDSCSTCRFQYFASIISTICVNSDVARRDLRLKLADINPALAPICRGPAFLSIGQPFLARAG